MYRAALDIFRETTIGPEITSTRAWLGAAYLVLDDNQTARRYTAERITELDAIADV
jgi:hypothetical protein